MRALFATGVAILALTACNEQPAPAAEASPPAEMVETAAAARDGCADIAAATVAMAEPEPFASLRSGNVMLGDHKVDDQFTTAAMPAGGTCTMGKMGGWNAGDPDMYVVNCTLFSAGTFDREENGVKAKAAFDAAKADLDKCLPAGWTSRDGGNNGSETTESLIYETADDLARKESSDFYVYPIELRKEFDEMGNLRGGRPPGWRVTLNFQKSGTAAPAAEQ